MNNNSRILIFITISFLIISGLLTYQSKRLIKTEDSTEAKKIEIETSKTAVNGTITQYTTQRQQNTQAEKQVAKKAILERDNQSDTDILFEYGLLLERAREYNAKHREE